MSPWLQESDWWSGNSEAHPLTVGSAIILLVFLWIRITGARSLAGITVRGPPCAHDHVPDGARRSSTGSSPSRSARPSRA
jgi:hypothetical protein